MDYGTWFLELVNCGYYWGILWGLRGIGDSLLLRGRGQRSVADHRDGERILIPCSSNCGLSSVHQFLKVDTSHIDTHIDKYIFYI